MPAVNLLPHELRPGRPGIDGRRLMVTAGCVVAAAIVGLAVFGYWRLARELEAVTAARAELEAAVAEAEELDRQLARAEQEQAALEDLWEKRFSWSQFFSELWSALPFGVRLSEVSVRGSELSLEGSAESAEDVARFLRMLSLVGGVRTPRLVKLEGGAELKFAVRAALDRPLLPERGEGH